MKKKFRLFPIISFLVCVCSVTHALTEEEILDKIENLPEIEINGQIISSTKRKKAQLYRILEEVRRQKRIEEAEEKRKKIFCKHCGKKQ